VKGIGRRGMERREGKERKRPRSFSSPLLPNPSSRSTSQTANLRRLTAHAKLLNDMYFIKEIENLS
jgi:hypothetical protein